MNSIENEIFKMYIKNRIGTTENKYCRHCKKNNQLAGPVSFFHVGSNFENDQHKIVFVGKNTWYNQEGFNYERYPGQSFADARKNGRDSLNGINNKKSKYWPYIRYVAEALYGNFELGIENISVTNIIKCNTAGESNNSSDNTPKNIKQKCIESRIFEREIEIMKPKHIIFLTGTTYDNEIKNINFGCSQSIEEENKRIDDGKIVWWTRKLCEKDNLKYSILRTSHPQGIHKDIFIKSIIDWIKYKKSPSTL